MISSLVCGLIFWSGSVYAHEQIPTYPKLEQTYLSNIVSADITIFNRREDVQYYKFSVFDKDWNPVRFAMTNTIIKVDYLKRETVQIYINNKDKDRVTYICSTSKIFKDNKSGSSVSSRICSKVKND